MEFLSLKGGCTGSSESTLVKMPHGWKSHVRTHYNYFMKKYCNQSNKKTVCVTFSKILYPLSEIIHASIFFRENVSFAQILSEIVPPSARFSIIVYRLQHLARLFNHLPNYFNEIFSKPMCKFLENPTVAVLHANNKGAD